MKIVMSRYINSFEKLTSPDGSLILTKKLSLKFQVETLTLKLEIHELYRITNYTSLCIRIKKPIYKKVKLEKHVSRTIVSFFSQF